MRKIRADLVGVVMSGGKLFAAGQDVPEDVDIHESLIEGAGSDDETSTVPEPTEGGSEAGDGPETPGETAPAPESTEVAPEAGDAPETPAEPESEDFSDLLGGDDEPKAPAKAPARGGRKAPAKRS